MRIERSCFQDSQISPILGLSNRTLPRTMRHITGIFCLILLLFSCRDRVICPAFQSTYILDDSVRIAYFSYIWKLDEVDRIKILEQRNAQKDSVNNLSGEYVALSDTLTADTVLQKPEIDYYAYVEDLVVPPREVRKNKFGIIKYEPYWLKNYHLRTAPMENVLAPKPEEVIQPLADESSLAINIESDSSLIVGLEADSSGIASLDSIGLSTDVIAQVEKEEEKGPRFLFKYDPEDNFNVEQAYYNKWFGDQLIYKRPRPKPEIAPLASDSVVTDVAPVDPANIQGESEQNLVPDANIENEDVEQEEPQPQETAPVEEPSAPPANEPVIEGEDDGLGF